jgi:PKD repeat protein
MYPLAPADATYQLGVPLFDEVVIDLPDFHYDGATFTIRTEGPSHDPDRFRYVESATLNGEPLAEPELDHAAVADGGTLTLSTTTDRVRWGGGSPVDPVAGERPPTDPDRDGRFEDVDGDGRAGYDDVVTLFESLDGVDDRADADRFDFNGNGRIDHGDVVELFESI